MSSEFKIGQPIRLCIIESHHKYPYRQLITETQLDDPVNKDMARITEFVELTFVERQPAEITEAKVAAIQVEIEKTWTQAYDTVNRLNNRKQELLALTQDPSPSDDETKFIDTESQI